MSLHSLLSVTIGVPNVEETAAYYAEFGLTPGADGWFSTADAGRQLRILPAPTRRLLALRVGADDADDLARAAANLARLGVPQDLAGTHLEATEPVTGVRVGLDVVPRVEPKPVPSTRYNGPGRLDQPDCRAPGFTRADPVRPRKLGHAVLGSTDYRATTAFFTDGLGFKVSDRVKDVGAFMRCSTDHHNVLVLAAPVSFLHHTSWQVDDIDDVGRGAFAMLEGRSARQPRCSGGTMRTGQLAWWATWLVTEPITSTPKPPAPREPSTTMSASRLASMSTSGGKPCTALTVIDSGRGSPASASALSVSAWAALRTRSVSIGSSG